MSLNELLGGTTYLESVVSPINGKLTVVKDLAWGVHIMGGNGGLTQSGGVAEMIWKTPLTKLKRAGASVGSCLILGLGGGGIAKLVRKGWPKAKITGVDIDHVIVELGKKYMSLDKYKVEIVIQDAEKYLAKSKESRFDLICVDTYQGDEFPAKFEEPKFMKLVKSHFTADGVAVFNRLYYGEKRPLATKFGEKLEKVFGSVEVIYPEANVMFVCR